ncbi:MAG: hypothetical protein AAB587_01085 [Patescibacteria group bacterium]
MRIFQQKRKFRRTLYSPLALIFLFIIALLSIHSAWTVYQKQVASTGGLWEAQIEWERLTQRQAELEHDISRINSDRGLEEEIREKFSVGKEGERVALIVGAAVPQEENRSSGIGALWQSVWRYITGRR